MIVFVLIYLAVLGIYFYTETSGVFLYRAVNKITLSSMFLLNFLVCLGLSGDFKPIIAAAAAGFILNAIGDTVLLFDFVKGAVIFALGNVCFTVYSILRLQSENIGFSDVWWCAVVFVLIIALFLCALYFLKIDYSEFGIKLPLYMITVTMHGCLGAALLFSGDNISCRVFGLGLMLFMISDYFLVAHKIYHKKNWVLRSNSGLYFLGMLLASCSFWL